MSVAAAKLREINFPGRGLQRPQDLVFATIRLFWKPLGMTTMPSATRSVCQSEWRLRKAALLFLLATNAAGLAIQRVEATANVVVWDTLTPLADTAAVADQAGWKSVPTDLLQLEADPPKASSDPGYYGRDYSFKGDVVVENHSLAAVFRSANGRVEIYSKANATQPPGARSANIGHGRKILEFVPLPTANQPARISHCEILRNAGDEVALEVFFSAPGATEVSATFVFGKTEIVEIKPAANMPGVSLWSSFEHAVVPDFIGDDLILSAADYPTTNTVYLPAENFLVGLVKGGADELVLTWPKGKQRLGLQLGSEPSGKRVIERLDFDNDGQSLYLAALSAPGIWHQETLSPSFLEKQVASKWQKPFAAKWKTQLYEAEVKTTFAFRESAGEIWRGVPGSYPYPVWFNGDDAYYHLSKKVPPQGESLIYFLEGQDTPESVSTPVDILKATLGRPASDAILDRAGRKLRTHHRRGGDGVRRACTCGCTEAIQAVFEARAEVAQQTTIAGDLGDMNYFVQRHVGRIDEYRSFAEAMIKFLQAKGESAPELKTYVEQLESIARQIPQEYSVQKENLGSPEHAEQLTRETLALTRRQEPNNLKAASELLKAWRAMGGAQDYVLAQCHTITRKLLQEAGYGCVEQPKAMDLAEEIRSRCRQILRNPDGYEIWADY